MAGDTARQDPKVGAKAEAVANQAPVRSLQGKCRFPGPLNSGDTNSQSDASHHATSLHHTPDETNL